MSGARTPAPRVPTAATADPAGLGVGWARAVRGAVLASASTSLALGGHLVAGGERPAVQPVLAAALTLAAVFVVRADRQRGRLALSVGTTAAQLVLHVTFALSTRPDPWARSGVAPGGAQVHAAGHVDALPAAGGLVGATPRMVVAHLLAGLLVAAVLARGERAAWAAARLLRRAVRLPVLRAPRLALPPRPAPPTSGAVRVPVGLLLARACARRGPPGTVPA